MRRFSADSAEKNRDDKYHSAQNAKSVEKIGLGGSIRKIHE
ncbi:hypothetical protein LEP1GSC052_0112 [Leptospira kmetyi serovar Malaysia str. Bejo-Iso9]|nr:hypothetical protein LEP1GSC052_0112 [Leptospira kmetyi serovar Malaysia str. Bejo-Iso9]